MKRLNIKFTFTAFLIISLVICAVATVFSAKDIQRNSYFERAKSLDLVMSKVGEHLNIAFDNKWDKARFLTVRIERLENAGVDTLTEELYDIYMETGEDFRVIDDEGIAYYYDGRREYWKDHRKVLPKTETFILSPLQFGVTDENYMKYIIPLGRPLELGNNVHIMYAVLTEPINDMNKDFNTGNYGEDCMSFIIDKQGTFIYENGSKDRMADSYNFLAYVERMVTFLYGETFESFKDNIQNGVNNTVLVDYNDKRYFMSHFSLDMEDWESIMLVPEENTKADERNFASMLLIDISVVFVTALILFICGFLYMWKQNINKQSQVVAAEKRSNEAKTNFLSAMSHDLRTPMNAIIGMTDIALHNRKDVPPAVQNNLEKIRLSSTHMLMLINDIMDIGKIESGKMSLNIAEFSIVKTTETLANLLRPLAKEKDIDLRIHTYNYRREYLLGDELRISQICINLATNAIKYTPSGGRVDINFKQSFLLDNIDKVCITCTVRDNGIGMSKDFQKVMYESFARATDSRVNRVPGSGLGLAICREMVQMMDGTLECESELGKGTTFSASVILGKGRPDEVYKLPALRVLVVDRDEMSTDALSRVFKRLSVEADIINDTAALPEVLKQNKDYRLAFVELGAPTNGGLDTVRILRGRFGESFPIILTDIADMNEYLPQIADAGIRLTMNKPYFYRTVYQTIQRALRGKPEDITVQDDSEESVLVGMKLLVAEDNDLNWEILCQLLEMNGARVQRAGNGKLCLDILEAAQPQEYAAVLMDVRMPVMDGREASRIIRQSSEEWLRSIPIIAMTADAFAEDINQCLEAGMDAHLPKPINLNRLLSVLLTIKDGSFMQGS